MSKFASVQKEYSKLDKFQFREMANYTLADSSKSEDFKFKQCLRLLTISNTYSPKFRLKLVEYLLSNVCDGADLVEISKGFYTNNIRNPN